jgi:hypothetical protein
MVIQSFESYYCIEKIQADLREARQGTERG